VRDHASHDGHARSSMKLLARFTLRWSPFVRLLMRVADGTFYRAPLSYRSYDG
jgi:hypothetical protein